MSWLPIVIVVAVVLLFAYSLCWAASKADEANDRLLEELRKEHVGRNEN